VKDKERHQKNRLVEQQATLRGKLSRIRCPDGKVQELECNNCKDDGKDCINWGIPAARCKYCREEVGDDRNCLFDPVPNRFVKRPTAEEVEWWKGKDYKWRQKWYQ